MAEAVHHHAYKRYWIIVNIDNVLKGSDYIFTAGNESEAYWRFVHFRECVEVRKGTVS